MCVHAGGFGFGRGVLLGLVVGRLCVGLLTGLVVQGDVGPVGRREVVDVVDSLGGLPRSRAPAVHPAPPCPDFRRPFSLLLPSPSPPLAASSRPPRWSTLVVMACVLLPRRAAFLPRRVAFHRSFGYLRLRSLNPVLLFFLLLFFPCRC